MDSPTWPLLPQVTSWAQKVAPAANEQTPSPNWAKSRPVGVFLREAPKPECPGFPRLWN